MAVEPLSHKDADALRALLNKDTAHNLYFLGLLEEFGFDGPSGRGEYAYYGRARAGQLTAALFVGGNGGLVVPAAISETDFSELCDSLAGEVRLQSALGDKALVQIACRAFARGTPKVVKEQRLFRVSADDLGPFTNPTLRLAREEDVAQLIPLAAGAAKELYGRDPQLEDPKGFEARVRQRVRAERSYVLEDSGELVFKIDLGARSEFGAELEAPYTAPAHRRKRHAILSLGQISRHLLSSLPRLTLRVAEDSPVGDMARKVGYVAGKAQRLVVM